MENGQLPFYGNQVVVSGNIDRGSMGRSFARLAIGYITSCDVYVDGTHAESMEKGGMSARAWFYLKVINSVMAVTCAKLYLQNGDIRDGQQAAILIVLVLFMQFVSPIFDEDEKA